jgi:hypothetical protein
MPESRCTLRNDTGTGTGVVVMLDYKACAALSNTGGVREVMRHSSA